LETIFRNGNILTMEPSSPKAEALAVQFGKIFKVGKN
jgi:predicted amidohydrolase YtcJ